MTAALSVRPAEEGDAAALATLRREFWQSQLDQGLLDVPQDMGASMEVVAKLIRRPRAIVVLAVDDRGAQGYAVGTVQVAPHLIGSRVAVVEEIYVRPAAATAGVGSRLAAAAFDHLLAGGEGRRQVRVLPGNAAALAFWGKQGFRPTLLTLEQG